MISAKSQERIDAPHQRFLTLSSTLEHVPNQSGGNAFSYPNALTSLCAESLSNIAQLVHSFYRRQVQHAALHARNLLELSIWCEYCSRSEQNCNNFYRDTIRDVFGIVNAFHKMAVRAPTEASGLRIEQAREMLSSLATGYGIDNLTDSYKQVSNAAKELGKDYETMYSGVNKILSKVVHPTAFAVNMSLQEKLAHNLLDLSLEVGIICGEACVQAIDHAASNLLP